MMIFREVHVSCVQSNDNELPLLLQARNHIRKQMTVYFVVCSYLITLCRFLSLLGNTQNIYFWIAKAGVADKVILHIYLTQLLINPLPPRHFCRVTPL